MRTPTLIAWSIFGGCVAFALGATTLAVLNLGTPTPRGMSLGPKAIELFFPIALLTFPAVGALIVATHGENRIGWAYLAIGLAGEALLLAGQYGLYGVVTAPGRLSAGPFVLWMTSWTWAPVSALLPMLIAIFPDGRPLGPRWRFIVWCAVVGAMAQATADGLHGRIDLGAATLSNPLGFDLNDEIRNWIYVAGTIVWSIATFGAIAALIARYKRSQRAARQQIKWFVYAGAASGLIIVGAAFFYDTEWSDLLAAASGFSVLAIPLATAIAIFRYRLYDIDLLINRTLVYGATSATLVLTYALAVLALGAALRPFTQQSELAVAGSTLAVAALVQPVRRRIQSAVDRRFYRSRYDAERTVDWFASRLRDEVDLDALRGELVAVVRDTVRPAHATLWLRERDQ